MLDKPTHDRFDAALKAGDFRKLAEELRAEGHGQVAIYLAFEAYWLTFPVERREDYVDADMDVIEGAMECIWGWCPRPRMWFDEALSDERLAEYRRAKQKDVRTEVTP